jgi:hypothetical protein
MSIARTVRRAAITTLVAASLLLTGCGAGGGYECDDVAPTESLESVTVLADDDCGDDED